MRRALADVKQRPRARPRVVALFVALAVLVVADVVAIAWLDSHECEVIGLAVGLLLCVWLGVVLSDPRVDWSAVSDEGNKS